MAPAIGAAAQDHQNFCSHLNWGFDPEQLTMGELLDELRPQRLLPRIADGIAAILPQLKQHAVDTPVDLQGLIDTVTGNLRGAARIAGGESGDLPLMFRDSGPSTAQLLTGTATDAATDAATGMGQAGSPAPKAMAIHLIWRDLDASLWHPDLLRPIPRALLASLKLAFKQIEAQSRGVIGADVFTAIQPALDVGAQSVIAIQLVMPAFIVPTMGEAPEYPETLFLKGRPIMLGIPVAGRPIVKPPIGRLPNMPPGSPPVPIGRPLTSQSLLADDGWRRFIDDIEEGTQRLALSISQSLVNGLAEGIVQNFGNVLTDLGANEELDSTLQFFESLLDNTFVEDIYDSAAGSIVGDQLRAFRDQIVSQLATMSDGLVGLGTLVQSLAGQLVNTAAPGPAKPLLLAGEPIAQVLEAIANAFKKDAEDAAFGELLLKPVLEWLTGPGAFGKTGEGLFGLLDEVHKAGFLTQAVPPTDDDLQTAGLNFVAGRYEASPVVKLDRLGRPQDFGSGSLHVLPGTLLVFRDPGGDVYREVAGVDAGKGLVTLASTSDKAGVDGGPISISAGTAVFAAPNYREDFGLEYLNLIVVYHAGLAYLTELARDQLQNLTGKLFEDLVAALAEDKPTVFSSQVRNSLDDVARDFLASAFGADSFDELKTGTRKRVVRTIPVGAIGGGRVVVDASGATWTLPLADFTEADEGRLLLVEGAANPSNNGEFSITDAVGAETVITPGGLLVNEDLGAGVQAEIIELQSRDQQKLAFGFTVEQLQAKAIEALEKRATKLVEAGLEKFFRDGLMLDFKEVMNDLQKELDRYNAAPRQTVEQVINGFTSNIARGLVQAFKISDLLNPIELYDNYKSLLSDEFVTDANDNIVRDAMGNPVSNPYRIKLQRLLDNLVASAGAEVIGRAFIVSCVCGFEFCGGRSAEGGGVLADWTANLFLFNKIRNNLGEGSGDGGGVFVRGYLPNVFLFNEIVDNRARDNGGGVYLDESFSIWMLNELVGNEATLGGGGYLSEDSLSFLALNDFSGNRARDGGGIASDATQSLLLGNDFSRNEAYRNGGGMLARESGLMVFNDFKRNTAEWGGAAAHVNGAAPSMTANTMKANVARQGGGGIAVLGQRTRPRLGANRVHGNTARLGGGIFVDSDANPRLNAVKVSGNEATEDGGGLYVQAGSKPLAKIAGASIHGNRADRGGGAWIGRTGGFLASALAANTARLGGGIYAESLPLLSLQGNSVRGNWAWERGGGGATLDIDTTWVLGNRFEDNLAFASNGAGLYVEGGARLDYVANDAHRNFVDGGSGGGLAVHRCERVLIDRCRFSENGTEHFRGTTAGRTEPDVGVGGALWLSEGDTVTVRNNAFTANWAERGGALGSVATDFVLVRKNTFERNCADLNRDGFGLGGAVYGTGSASRIEIGGDSTGGEGNRFIGNTAGTPAALRPLPAATIDGSGGAIAIDDGPTAIIRGNDMRGNAATDLGGAIFLRDVGTGSEIGGGNERSPADDSDATGRREGNFGVKSCLVPMETRYPGERRLPEVTEAFFDRPARSTPGVRNLVFSQPDPAALQDIVDQTADATGADSEITARVESLLDDSLAAAWPAERNTTSDWNTPVPGSGAIPPWPPQPGWMPSLPVDTYDYDFRDAVPGVESTLFDDDRREIVTRRGGFFAIVRGAGTRVFGNWFLDNYATEMGGAGYVEGSDERTLVGRDGDPDARPENLFIRNLATLGGGLAVTDGSAVRVMANEFGGIRQTDGAVEPRRTANYATAGGGVFVKESAPTVADNLIVANVAAHTIDAADSGSFPEEMSRWIGRGLLAFGGGIAIAGTAASDDAATIRDNELRSNVVLGMPDFGAFPVIYPSANGASASTPPSGSGGGSASGGSAAPPPGGAGTPPGITAVLTPLPGPGASLPGATRLNPISRPIGIMPAPNPQQPSPIPFNPRPLPAPAPIPFNPRPAPAPVPFDPGPLLGLIPFNPRPLPVTPLPPIAPRPTGPIGGIFTPDPLDPVPSREPLELPDGSFLFGGAIGLLETGRVDILDNDIRDNSLVPARGTPPTAPLHLVGGGIGALLVDTFDMIPGKWRGSIRESVVRVPHEGLGDALELRLLGGGVGIMASRGIKLRDCVLEHNSLERETPRGDVATTPVEGWMRGGAIGLDNVQEFRISGCRLAHNALWALDEPMEAAGGGIGGSDVEGMVEEGEIVRNFSHRDGGGVSLAGTCAVTLEHLTVADNDAMECGSAVQLKGNHARTVMRGNLVQAITGWNGGALFAATGLTPPTIEDNNFWAPAGPVAAGDLTDPVGSNDNVSVHPGFADPDASDYAILNGSPSRLAARDGRDFGGTLTTTAQFGSFRTLNVPDDYTTITAALADARPGEVVQVAAGTYSEQLSVPAGVALVATDGPDFTFIDTSADNAVVSLGGSGKQTVVAGFTLRGAGSGTAVEANGAFSGYVTSNVIQDFDRGISVRPVDGVATGGNRAWLGNNTVLRCDRTGVEVIGEEHRRAYEPHDRPCRGSQPASIREHRRPFKDPVMEHNIVQACDTGVAITVSGAAVSPVVSSRLVGRNDLNANAVQFDGFVSDLLNLNNNVDDDPFLLPAPKPQEAHPAQSSGSAVLGGTPERKRTIGALEKLPAKPTT